MKTLLAALTLVISLPVAAETITLGQTNCGTTRNCQSVPNSAGAEIQILDSVQYSSVYVNIDGLAYTSPTGASDLITNLVLVDESDANAINLNAVFSHTTRLIRVGRGQRYVTTWVLENGSIVR